MVIVARSSSAHHCRHFCLLLWLLQLARVVYVHGNDNQKGQAMLCTVYFRYEDCPFECVCQCLVVILVIQHLPGLPVLRLHIR